MTELEQGYIETSKLIPYVNNAKIHSDSQIMRIASSMKEFGFLAPIVIDKDNGIIAGHGRVMAGKKLNIEKLPFIRAESLTDAQKKAYVLADNRLGEIDVEWDFDLVSQELETLQEMNFDIGLTGFSFDDLIENEEDFSDSNSEYSDSDFQDEMELVFKFNMEQYNKVREELAKHNESLEISLLKVLML